MRIASTAIVSSKSLYLFNLSNHVCGRPHSNLTQRDKKIIALLNLENPLVNLWEVAVNLLIGHCGIPKKAKKIWDFCFNYNNIL